MSRIELIVGQIGTARQYTLSLLEDLGPDDWFRQPSEGVTHIAWQVGHLAVAEYFLTLERIRGQGPDDAELIPLTQFPSQIAQLTQGDEGIVVICRGGRRSAYAVRLLIDAGFSNAHYVTGGLLAWADEVDPSMAKY